MDECRSIEVRVGGESARVPFGGLRVVGDLVVSNGRRGLYFGNAGGSAVAFACRPPMAGGELEFVPSPGFWG
jgi:hypothetical protein